MDITALEDLKFEIRDLENEITAYCNDGDYIYTDTYKNWIIKYNLLVNKYNLNSKSHLENYALESHESSSTGKTIRRPAVDHFLSTVKGLYKKIDNDIKNNDSPSSNKLISNHQMRYCFKIDIPQCPKNPPYNSREVFIAMPFKDEYLDSYQYGIVPALQSAGYEPYRADNEIKNKDIMCKLCCEMQRSGLVIVNVSGLNPNVMLEQGLAYGLGKPVIMIKDKTTSAISDLGCIEYIEYSHAADLQKQLFSALQSIHPHTN